MNKKIKILVSIVAIIAVLTSLFTGCGTIKEAAGNIGIVNTIDGDDVFNGERFTEMIWGYYESDCYEYNGSNEDAAVFLQEMEYFNVGEEGNPKLVSVLPLTLQAGKYSHFVSSFTYEDEIYEPYTEKGKAMFRKAYIAEVGDMTEEQFKKIERLLQLDVMSVLFAYDNGAIQSGMLHYKLENNKIELYDLNVDEDYNIAISSKPILTYDFLHEGGKLILRCKGVQRNYVTGGTKESDSGFYVSGYAINDANRYKDLDGFSFSKYKGYDFSVYVYLSNGDSPIDPVMTMDYATGDFTISWEECWTDTATGIDRINDPRTISGKMIACTSYGFTNYEGMILLIDGKCYRYLMSEKEYEERKYGDVLGDGISVDDVGDETLQEIETVKRNILEELKAALDAAGIDADIDTVSGKVSLEANFLFATDSAEVSADGKDYLNRFIDAYTSVVFGDTYGDYISNIVIEGHTDTSGSYNYNQKLSEKRANAVASHCIERNAQLQGSIETKGCSYDYPVYNDDGSVNMEKSRRVSFRFVFAGV